MLIFCKINADISKSKRAFVLKGVFSLTTYVSVLMYQTPSTTLTNYKQGGNFTLPPPLTSKQSPKKRIQNRVNIGLAFLFSVSLPILDKKSYIKRVTFFDAF